MDDFKPLQINHYLVFVVAGQKFAIDIVDIESIHASNRTELSDSMEDLRTAVHLHKRVIPIINLRKKLNLKGGDELIQPSLVFLKRVDSKKRSLIGIQVDQILEIVETLVPKKPEGKSNRLIKAMVGLKTEVIPVLRFADIVVESELSNVESEILN